MMLFKQLQGAQGFNAVSFLGSISELASGTSVLVDSDGGVSGLGGRRSGPGVIVGLQFESC